MLNAAKANLDQAFEFKIDDSLLIRRISGRRVHPASGRTYHIDFFPPKVEGKDDVRECKRILIGFNSLQVTHEPLIQRSDDNETTLTKRLESYHRYTTPVVGYYQNKNILTTLDAAQSGKTVFNHMKSVLDRVRPNN
jgi:adenylate kinase